VLAVRQLGIPSICVVDLFAIDEVKWIGAPDYADQVCVLNESVRQFLVAAGRSEDQVVVTGNPGFDALNAPGCAGTGAPDPRAAWLAGPARDPVAHPG
jgi:hypothetical protein